MECPNQKCKSTRVNKSGIVATVNSGKKQRFICRECGKTFYIEEAADPPKKR